MSKPSVLFPCRIDLDYPIQSIHREVGKELSSHYRFIGYATNEFDEEIASTFYRLYTISTDSSRFKKAAMFTQGYLRHGDVIHTGFSGPKTHPLLIQSAKARGAKIIHTHHTVTPNHLDQQRWLSNNADVVTAVSPFIASWVTNSLGTTDIEVIPNGVDLALYTSEAASTVEKQILFVGRLSERKHPEIVVKIAQEIPGYRFYIRGEGPLEEELKESAPKNVNFLNRMSKQKLAEKYAESAVTLCPFESEGFGLVVVESMAAGTPVLGLNDGNLSRLVSPQSGELCKSLNVDEWVTTLTQMADSHESYDPRSRAEQYSWESVAQEYHKAYQKCLTG